MNGFVANIQRFCIHDGPGIRTTVFFQGCPLNCWWCHNVEFIPIDGQTTREYSVDSLLEEILKDRVFFETSEGGVTFSGGEPLTQPHFLNKVLKACRKRNIHTAIDTSGYAQRNIMLEIASQANLLLFDLKLFSDKDHIKYTGVSNKIILDNLIQLDEQNYPMRIRIPLIPGISDQVENIQGIIELIQSLKNTHPVDILPYHQMAEEKYKRLEIPYKIKGARQKKHELQKVRNMFKKHNITVNI
ncbi:MAG: glycyl-radical enzyme activating protein [Bacteroidales bacterium]|nr:glycyl-radical enzyme activating protein [Bacteroidales bacterium]MCF8399459.1 glycyl-radical enzyme activating protein [Bacteroidales bacterium]